MSRYEINTEILRGFIESSGLSYTENSRSWIFTCPRCNKSKKLYLSKSFGRFVCWRCKETDGFQGRPEYALAELLHTSVADVCQQLYGDTPLRADSAFDCRLEDFFGKDDELDDEANEHEIIKWPHDFYPIDDPHYSKRGADYMRTRGVPIHIQRLYDLRYSPELQRVFFPIGERGYLYGYQGRLIVPHEYEDEETGELKEVPKILSSKGVRRDRLLMFADRLRNSEHAVVTEGPVDAIKAHYCRGNVATMGKEVSDRQIKLLLDSGVKKVYIALDPDATEAVERLISTMNGDVGLYEMIPQKLGVKTDLGAMSFEEVYELFLGAQLFTTRLFIDINFQ